MPKNYWQTITDGTIRDAIRRVAEDLNARIDALLKGTDETLGNRVAVLEKNDSANQNAHLLLASEIQAGVQSVNGQFGAVVLDAADVGAAPTVHDHVIADVTDLQTDLNAKADLVDGKVPTAQIPTSAITDTFVVASEAAMLALVAQRGDVAVRQDLSKSFILQGDDPTKLSNWVELLSPTDAVSSVNGKVGVVVLSASDVGAAPTSHDHPIEDITGMRVEDWNNLKVHQYKSGFFQGYTTDAANAMANLGWPCNGSSYLHLLSDQHTNAVVPYAMQIAGGFFDQEFYGRKVNNDTSRGWVRFWTSGNFTNGDRYGEISGPNNLTQNGIAYVTGTSLFNITDGALYAQAYSSNWVHQIYGDYRTGQIAVRGNNSGTWQSWRVVLDSGNFGSYALPLSGGTMTGAIGAFATADGPLIAGVDGHWTGAALGGSARWIWTITKARKDAAPTLIMDVEDTTDWTNLWGLYSNGSTVQKGTTQASSFILPEADNSYGAYSGGVVYPMLRNHGNGNVSLNACTGGLYIGYTNTTEINLSKPLYLWNGASIVGSWSADGTLDAKNGLKENGTSLSSKYASAGHTYHGLPDTRSVATTPSTYTAGSYWNFKQNATVGLAGGTYSAVMGVGQWADDSGGGNHELAFSDSGGEMYHRYGTRASGWGTWGKIWNSRNFDPSTFVPPGTIVQFGGRTAPGGWLLCRGQSLSRTDYEKLFSALIFRTSGNTTNGSTTLSSLSIPYQDLGLGAIIEGPGIPANSYVQAFTLSGSTITSVTLNQAATATAYGITLTVIPYGATDSTHFNLPNFGGRTAVGAGAAPGDATATNHAIGQVGGEELHALNAAESGLVGHNHSQNAHNHPQVSHYHTTPAHNHAAWQDSHSHYFSFTRKPGGSYCTTTEWGGVDGSQTKYDWTQYTSSVAPNVYTGTANPNTNTAIVSLNDTAATNNAVAAANALNAHQNMPPYVGVNYIIKT